MLPEAARRALWSWSAGLDPAVWRRVPAENLHVTLAFLGERAEADAVAAGEVLRRAAAAAAPLELRCAAAIGLPPRRPRVAALSLADADGRTGLADLQDAVADGLVRAGVYERERRAFLPHVTVGRARARGGSPGAAPSDGPACGFAATSVALFASRAGRYETVASAVLGDATLAR